MSKVQDHENLMEHDNIPHEYICPISLKIMRNPVMI